MGAGWGSSASARVAAYGTYSVTHDTISRPASRSTAGLTDKTDAAPKTSMTRGGIQTAVSASTAPRRAVFAGQDQGYGRSAEGRRKDVKFIVYSMRPHGFRRDYRPACQDAAEDASRRMLDWYGSWRAR